MTDTNLYNVGYDVGFEDGFKEAQGRVKELEAEIKELHYAVTAAHLKGYMDGKQAAEARIEELKAALKKLEYWFDTDQEILDVMGNNEKADHMRKLKMIRDALGGDSDD